MTPTWKDVRRARIPVRDLPALAELRGTGEVRVFVAGEIAWISWDPRSDTMQEMLVRRIMPLPEAVLYTQRDGHWYQLGAHLPSFDAPHEDGSDWPLLERIIFPEAIVATRPRSHVARSGTLATGAGSHRSHSGRRARCDARRKTWPPGHSRPLRPSSPRSKGHGSNRGHRSGRRQCCSPARSARCRPWPTQCDSGEPSCSFPWDSGQSPICQLLRSEPPREPAANTSRCWMRPESSSSPWQSSSRFPARRCG